MNPEPAPVDALAGRAKQLWEYLAGAGDFSHAIRVGVSPKSRLCPPGWVGIVVIGDDTLVTAPDNKTARVVGQVLNGLSADAVTSAGRLGRRLAAAEFLGPAALAYLDPADFRPWPGDVTITRLERDDLGLRLFLVAADADELEESGIEEITTQAFAVRNHGQVLAAAGYRDWPCGTVHLGVLTAAAARGHGLARAAASAAVIHALQEGRLPQWRARSEASLRVARALGFRELGSQVSVRLAPDILGEAGTAFRSQDEPRSADSVLTVERTATAPGLLLRPWTEQDIPAIVAAHRDPVMRQWLRHPVTTSDEALRMIQARRADCAAGSGFSFAVLQAEPGVTGDLVGSVSIRGLADAAASGEVGYWITTRARGRGIAARAVDAVCEWAFRLPRQRPLERIELLHSAGNHASCRVAEKAGFAFSAVLPPLLPDFPDDGHLHIRLAAQPS